jgi:hypothetical protein
MPAASRRRMAEVRRMLSSEEWERVEVGLALAMGDPHTRRIIMCGMIPTARGMTASVLSEVARRIDRKWRGKAQEWLKERAVTQQMESVQFASIAKGSRLQIGCRGCRDFHGLYRDRRGQ